MAEKEARFRDRRGTFEEWVFKNPILAAGEHGYEIGSGKFKIGDGVHKWTELNYFAPARSDAPGANEALINHIESETPHPVYDDGPSLALLYENAKV